MLEKSHSYEKELIFIRIYVELTPNAFNFYSGKTAETHFRKIELNNIIKIGHQFKHSNCFDLIVSDDKSNLNSHIYNEKFKRGSVTICTQTKGELKQWIKHIMLMKGCLPSSKSPINPVIGDFYSINNLLNKKNIFGNPDSNYFEYLELPCFHSAEQLSNL